MAEEVVKKKKEFSFPTAYTVLFIVLVLAAVLTYVIPAGTYSQLVYDGDNNVFEITAPDQSTSEMPATQETLDSLNVTAKLEKFTDGTLYNPVAIPGTYEQLERNGQGFVPVMLSMTEGVYETIDIILFVFIIGGCIGVLNYMGAFNAGIAALSKASKGKEYILIVAITFLIAMGGTSFGMAEETIALYPILIPVFLAANYDAMVCIATIYLGSTIGCMFSTVNPFSVVIASNAAGVNFTSGLTFRVIGLALGIVIVLVYILRYAQKVKKDPAKSLIYEDMVHIKEKFSKQGEAPPLTLRYKIVLLLFLLTFCVMIWGVSSQGWWFGEMTALFIVSGVAIGVLGGLSERDFCNEFVNGAAELMGVALVIGIARAVDIILEAGKVSDTILQSLSSSISGISPSLFIVLMMLVFVVLGFFINSSSGLAVLSIPIMAPLADSVGIPRESIITAYLYGLGIITFITPTGLILASLELVDVTYDKWLKFVIPLVGIIGVFATAMLLIEVNFFS